MLGSVCLPHGEWTLNTASTAQASTTHPSFAHTSLLHGSELFYPSLHMLDDMKENGIAEVDVLDSEHGDQYDLYANEWLQNLEHTPLLAGAI